MSTIMQKIDPKNTDLNLGTTIVWIFLFLFLWIVGLNQILSLGLSIGSDITLFLSTGIGAYFVGKATSDMQKKTLLDSDKSVKTTFGVRPKLARAILAISLLIIYGWFVISNFLDTNTVTLLVNQPGLEIISTLFWGVVGYYIPEFYNYFRRSS